MTWRPTTFRRGAPSECVGTVNPRRAKEILRPQAEWRVEGHNAYFAFFAGLAWVIVVTRHSIDMTQKGSPLSEDRALLLNISSRTGGKP